MDLEIDYDLSTLLGNVSLDYKLQLGSEATGNTPIDFGDMVSGVFYYRWTNAEGKTSYESGHYYFNTQHVYGAHVISSNHINVYGVLKDDAGGASSPNLYVSTGGGEISSIQLIGGGYYNFSRTIDSNRSSDKNQVDTAVGVGRSSPPPLFYESPNTVKQPDLTKCGSFSDVHPLYTTSSQVHKANSKIPYLPISGKTMSYNDIRAYLVDEWNEQNPDETISINDLPAFDEQEATEQQSYDIQPFSIDYDEILGEKEMESIIAETRYILDTSGYSLEVDYGQAVSEPYGILKQNSKLADEYAGAVGKVYNIATDVVPADIIAVYGFIAFLSVVMWFILRR